MTSVMLREIFAFQQDHNYMRCFNVLFLTLLGQILFLIKKLLMNTQSGNRIDVSEKCNGL